MRDPTPDDLPSDRDLLEAVKTRLNRNDADLGLSAGPTDLDELSPGGRWRVAGEVIEAMRRRGQRSTVISHPKSSSGSVFAAFSGDPHGNISGNIARAACISALRALDAEEASDD